MNLWTSSSEKGARAFFTLGCMGWRTLSKQVPDDKEGEGKAAAAIMFTNGSTLLSAHSVPGTGSFNNWPLVQPRPAFSPAAHTFSHCIVLPLGKSLGPGHLWDRSRHSRWPRWPRWPRGPPLSWWTSLKTHTGVQPSDSAGNWASRSAPLPKERELLREPRTPRLLRTHCVPDTVHHYIYYLLECSEL